MCRTKVNRRSILAARPKHLLTRRLGHCSTLGFVTPQASHWKRTSVSHETGRSSHCRMLFDPSGLPHLGAQTTEDRYNISTSICKLEADAAGYSTVLVLKVASTDLTDLATMTAPQYNDRASVASLSEPNAEYAEVRQSFYSTRPPYSKHPQVRQDKPYITE